MDSATYCHDIIERAVRGKEITLDVQGYEYEWSTPITAVCKALDHLYNLGLYPKKIYWLGEKFLELRGVVSKEMIRELEKKTTRNPFLHSGYLDDRCIPLTYILLLRAIAKEPREISQERSIRQEYATMTIVDALTDCPGDTEVLSLCERVGEIVPGSYQQLFKT